MAEMVLLNLMINADIILDCFVGTAGSIDSASVYVDLVAVQFGILC